MGKRKRPKLGPGPGRPAGSRGIKARILAEVEGVDPKAGKLVAQWLDEQLRLLGKQPGKVAEKKLSSAAELLATILHDCVTGRELERATKDSRLRTLNGLLARLSGQSARDVVRRLLLGDSQEGWSPWDWKQANDRTTRAGIYELDDLLQQIGPHCAAKNEVESLAHILEDEFIRSTSAEHVRYLREYFIAKYEYEPPKERGELEALIAERHAYMESIDTEQEKTV